jgi:hypothetical protein
MNLPLVRELRRHGRDDEILPDFLAGYNSQTHGRPPSARVPSTA